MAETLTTLKTRRSCRAYRPEPIEEEKLNAIIEAGTYAATGMGKQSPIIIAVTDKALRDKLSKMNAAVLGADMDPFYGAQTDEAICIYPSSKVYKLYEMGKKAGNLENVLYLFYKN